MRGIQNIEKLIESGELEVLWENPNPTSAFAPQAIVVPNADKYDLLFWVFRTDITNQGIWLDTEVAEPNSFVYPNAVFPSGNNTYSYARPIRLIANNQYRVDSGYKDATTNNDIMVPLKVCGIRIGGLSAQGWHLEGIVFGPGEYNTLAKQLYDKVSWSLDKDYKLVDCDFNATTVIGTVGRVMLGNYQQTDFICQGAALDDRMQQYYFSLSTDVDKCRLRLYTFVPDTTKPVGQTNYDTYNYASGRALMIYSRDFAGSADPAVTITDDIEAGNMYPVTSNAVAEFKSLFTPKYTGSTEKWGSTVHLDINYTVTDSTFKLITGFSIAGGNGVVAIASARFIDDTTINLRLVRTATISQDVFVAVYYI